MTSPHDDTQGRPLGSNYLMFEAIGRGATGRVYRGVRQSDGEPVAIKVLKEEIADDPDAVARFLGERATLLRLHDPHLVPVLDQVAEGPTLALVMELNKGSDLRRHLTSVGGTLEPAEAARMMADVCEGLAAVHAAGLVHRDIKPENILLQESSLSARVTDFGIASVAASSGLSRTSTMIGTPDYMAPEVLMGNKATTGADVYAVGIVLYELLTGRTPFAADNPATVIYGHTTQPLDQPPGVSRDMWKVIANLTGKDPAQRIDAPTAAAALREVQLGRGNETLQKIPPPPPISVEQAPLPPVEPRRTRVFALSGVSVILAISLAAYGLFGRAGTHKAVVKAPPASYSFGPQQEGLFLLARQWGLSPDGRTLIATLDVTNPGGKRARATVYEILPKSLAPTLASVAFSPAPSIVQRDPVVSWAPTLQPDQTMHVTYRVKLAKVAGQSELNSWGTAQKSAEKAFLAQHGLKVIALASLTVSPQVLSMRVGDRAVLQLDGRMDDGHAATADQLSKVVWKSSNLNVTTVTAGTVVAVGAGGANVVAQAGTVTARVPVVVAGAGGGNVAAGRGSSRGGGNTSGGPTSQNQRTDATPGSAAGTTTPRAVVTPTTRRVTPTTRFVPPTTAPPVTTSPPPPIFTVYNWDGNPHTRGGTDLRVGVRSRGWIEQPFVPGHAHMASYTFVIGCGGCQVAVQVYSTTQGTGPTGCTVQPVNVNENVFTTVNFGRNDCTLNPSAYYYIQIYDLSPQPMTVYLADDTPGRSQDFVILSSGSGPPPSSTATRSIIKTQD